MIRTMNRHILATLWRPDVGGQPLIAHKFISGLKSKNYKVVLLHGEVKEKQGLQIIESLDEQGVTCITSSRLSNSSFIGSIFDYLKLARRENPDLLLSLIHI